MTETPPEKKTRKRTPRQPARAVPAPRPIQDEAFLSIPEMADIAGVSRKTVEQWRNRRREIDIPFIEPDDHIGDRPIWRLSRYLLWLEASHREGQVDAEGKPVDDDRPSLEDRLKDWDRKRAAGGYRRDPKRQD